MTEPDSKPEAKRDARRARERILDAAEAAFAAQGFHGARTEAIAQSAGCNISLLFQYFGDKLGLYSAVLEHAQRELQALQRRLLAPLAEAGTAAAEPVQFRHFLAAVVRTTFDYILDHPRLLRVVTWEMAAGWQTYAQIASRWPADENGAFDRLFQKARRAGGLRSTFPPLIQLTLVSQVCQSYLVYLPVYQTLQPGHNVASKAALARAREQLVDWVVAALVADVPPPRKPASARRAARASRPPLAGRSAGRRRSRLST